MSADLSTPQAFIDYWSKAEANERANSQSFLIGLSRILGVPQPKHSHVEGYSFEYPVKVPGSQSTNFVDLYRRGCFILESKQFVAPQEEQTDLELTAIKAGVVDKKKKSGPLRGSGAWDDAMIRAKGQAERYVRYLPTEEPNPPFIIVCDVGHSLEIYADFTQNGKAYLPYPDPRSFRIQLKDLADEKVRERLHLIWTNPTALDPAKVSAEVTREIAGYLAELAKSLEHQKHDPEVVAQFLTRCLFCMFAEDVGLLPERSFTELLHSIPPDGSGFVKLVSTLFREMNEGTNGDPSVILRKKLLRFNGGLFADDTVLPVSGLQLGLLKQAASKQWRNVEPAIFGTLLERALNPTERHALGAHFTPRAYVERLVLPTVIQPLREEWDSVRAAAVALGNRDEIKKAREEINRFHDRLCEVKVLDPACGSGNFLYVALEHMKRLEGEVIDMASALGADQRLELSTHTVDPHQFLGIELNPRAASIAELVLWIGYLQWHFRTRGQTMPEEPVLKSFKNIECRDAVLEYDGEPVPARDENGEIITQWDGRSKKVDFVTGRDVPDETKRITLLAYSNPRPAKWPTADYIVGNPPFIGDKRMRDDLGDGYTETLRATYRKVPDSADFVLYWWHKAAQLVRTGKVKRFGFITTNSLRQSFNRRIVEAELNAKPPLSLVFAVPDHPWVDTVEGAAVRIAMSVGSAGSLPGELLTVTDEQPQSDGSSAVTLNSVNGKITADLKVNGGTIESKPVSLNANKGMAFTGMYPLGQGFVLLPEQIAEACGNDSDKDTVVKPFVIARDLAQTPRSAKVIDFFPLDQDDARQRFPNLFQWVLTRVKPERDVNPVLERRRNWWLFTRPIPVLRNAVSNLKRYIVVPRTAKWFNFQFVSADTIPDTSVVAIVSDDSLTLGVLSSRIHLIWAMAVGGRLEDRPRYQHQETFNLFPFPNCDEATQARIRVLAEELDAHRKQVQAEHGLTLTGLYNVLEKLRANQPLTDKEKTIHHKGLVSILKQLHDDLDAAVFAAYGWPATLTDAEILTRLVALNAERAAEEKRGLIRWLRPDYQNPKGTANQTTLGLKTAKKAATKKAKVSKTKTPWPKTLPERMRATEQALQAAGAPVTAADLTKRFARANAGDIQELLETLAVMGKAHEADGKFSM
ncbi:MAG: hypothetical protein RLZZ214_4257 [Verrucomicrobiota bacterium]|jgi:hypothetical protein